MKKLFSPGPLFRKGTPFFLRALHALRLAVTFFVASTVGVVLIYRFVPPPATPLMLLRLLDQREADEPLKLSKDWRSLDEISPHLAASVIAAEDQRFYDHHGFDFEAIRNAMRRNARGGRVVGASTISQQTAKNVFLWPARSWTRKGLEVWFTFLIETLWPKRRILEMYLNVAEMGPGIYGAQAASRHWFGRDAAGLNLRQAALLASILPKPLSWSPSNPPRRVTRRQAWILRQLGREGPRTRDRGTVVPVSPEGSTDTGRASPPANEGSESAPEPAPEPINAPPEIPEGGAPGTTETP